VSTVKIARAAALAIAIAGGIFDATRATDVLALRWRGHLAGAALSTLLLMRTAGWDLPSIGLTFEARPSWRYWKNVGVFTLVIVGCFVVGYVLATGALSNPDWLRSRIEVVDASRLLELLLIAPVLEEIVYRLCVCAVLQQAFGRTIAILCSASVFMLIHFLRGNLDVSNGLGGIVLAWAFLTSRTLAVPILFHAAGNLLVIALHILGAARLGYPVLEVLFSMASPIDL
jgi:membrane protease YdiL (CAAX protease family)